MAALGYSYVPEKGYVAFGQEMTEGAWKDVSIKKYDVADRRLAAGVLLGMARPVLWKLRVTWVLGDLRVALGMATADVMLGLDGDWDRAQRRFHFTVAGAGEHPDPAVREAAARVRERLLLGNGTAQTNLGWDEEVDFGRQQLELAGEGRLAADIKRLGAGDHIAEIRKTTEALATGLGRGPGQKRAGARSQRVRESLVACSATFNAVHDEMAWIIDHTDPGTDRDQLVAFHAPFQALLDRYPPPGASSTKPVTMPTPTDGGGTP